MATTGLAFSGGGIRSAALCSGVLRRLLQRNTKNDYLSCVSGGGYTGKAYLDWKYRHGKKDAPQWHQKFFDRMGENTGLMCNWRSPVYGILDTIVLISLMLLVSVIMPCIVWGSTFSQWCMRSISFSEICCELGMNAMNFLPPQPGTQMPTSQARLEDLPASSKRALKPIDPSSSFCLLFLLYCSSPFTCFFFFLFFCNLFIFIFILPQTRYNT